MSELMLWFAISRFSMVCGSISRLWGIPGENHMARADPPLLRSQAVTNILHGILWWMVAALFVRFHWIERSL